MKMHALLWITAISLHTSACSILFYNHWDKETGPSGAQITRSSDKDSMMQDSIAARSATKFDIKQLHVDNRELSQELLNTVCDFNPEQREDPNGMLNPRSGSNGR